VTHSDLRDRYTRIVAAAIGACLVVALIAVSLPEGGEGGVMPASLRVTATQDGALAVTPAAPMALLNASLRPGGNADGHLVLRNQTGERLAVGLRAEPSSTALDGIVAVRILAGEKLLAETTLQGLRQGSEGTVRIRPGGAARIDVTASIAADVETGYEARNVAVELVPVYAGGR
jgi:hypothetical protein